MEVISDDTISNSINHLSNKDKNEALNLLIKYGLKQYITLTNNQLIDINILRRLTDGKSIKSKSESNVISSNGIINNTINKKDTKSPNISNDYRLSRINAMSNYPFVDEGSISDIIKPKSNSNILNFLTIGAPGKKRLAIKAYHEFESGNVGLKIIDIPKAIKSLGLIVPNTLENIELSNKENEFIPISKNNINILNITISLNQWFEFLNKYIVLYNNNLLKTLDFNKFISLIDEKNNTYHYQLNDNDNKSDIELDSISIDSAIDKKERKIKKNKKIDKAIVLKKPKDTHTTRLRNVKSRLKDQIDVDRNTYIKSQQQMNDAALRAIARHRYEQLMAEDHSIESMQSSKRNSKILNSKVLSTGSGALEIADAFLSGPLAKEINSYDSSDESDSSIKISKHSDNKVDNHFDKIKLDKKLDSNIDKSIDSSSSLYKHSWKSSKGGWMADFGPNHTHSFKKISNEVDNISSSNESDKPLQSYLSNTVDKSIYSNISNSPVKNRKDDLSRVNELIAKYSSDISQNSDISSLKVEKIIKMYKNDIDISTEEDSLSFQS